MTDHLTVTCTGGPPELRRRFGHLEFNAGGVRFNDVTTDRQTSWAWSSTAVTFEAEAGRRVDRNTLAGGVLLGLLLRRRRFRVQIQSDGEPVTFEAAGDAWKRDSLVRHIVDAYPAAAGRVSVGTTVVS